MTVHIGAIWQINVKKLNSLKHFVEAKSHKTAKIILRHRAWSIITNIVLIIATIKYS